jgi:fibronectin type 3 domain-containing protein
MKHHRFHLMKIKNILSLTALFLLCRHPADAQQKTSITAGVDSTRRYIVVKWFTEQVTFAQGVHLYRREQGKDWERITGRPLKKGDMPVPPELLQKDSTLATFVDAARSAAPSELRGFVGAMMMVMAVQNNYFARYMGLCYLDEGVVPGRVYRYRVFAVNSGREIPVGETADITAGDYRPPAPLAGLSVKPGDGEAEIIWQPEPDRCFGANVYRSSNRNPTPVKANRDIVLVSETKEGTGTYPKVFFVDTVLNNHYQYTYYIRGVDYLGNEGLPSETVTVAPQDRTPPEPPQRVSLTVDGMKVTLAWDHPDVPSADMEGYHVYRSKRLKSGYAHVNRKLLGRDVASYADNVPAPGEYFYYVASVDSAGNEGKSFGELAYVEDVYPPAAPRGLTAKADSGKITLQWLANHDPDLMGYQIFRTVEKDNPAYYVLLNAAPLTDTVFTDRLPPVSRNSFHYKVAAIDSALNRSDYSEPTFGVMPDLFPPQRPFIKRITQQDRSLLVEWIPNTDADLMHYHVYRMDLGDSAVRKLNLMPVRKDVDRFTDYQVTGDGRYRYHLTATDSAGNVSSPSEYFYAVYVEESPAVKSPLLSFNASYSRRQKNVSLKWKLDGNAAVKGAIVYRSDGEQTFVPVTGLLKSSDCSDKNLAEGQTCTYRLHVFLDSGEVFKSEEIRIEVK